MGRAALWALGRSSPVHVLDLSMVLPGYVITGIMLLRGKVLAFVLAPIWMGFTVLMSLAVAGVAAALTLKGSATDYVLAGAFAASAADCTILLVRYLRR